MKLYAHQQKIVDEDPSKCGLFLGTGSGKTRTALLLARGKILVICPKTQKEDGNWEREAQSLYDDSRVPRRTSLTVLSKETFRRDYKKLGRFDTVIVDECHTMLGVQPSVRYRNRVPEPKTSQLFEALDGFLRVMKPDRLYLCTATIIRSPMTVWGAYRLLNPTKDGSTFRGFLAFRDKYYMKLPMPGRDVWNPRTNSDLKDDLAAMVRRLGYVGRLEDFFDVPDQVFRTDRIELTDMQKKRLKDMVIEYPDPLVRTGKQHQIENGCLAGDEFNAPEIYPNAKIDKILDYALEFPRMIVFAKYTVQIVQIAAHLRAAGVPAWELTGQTMNRDEVLAYAKENDGVLVCQAQISAGWELPNTPVMIFASRTYSWVDYEQSFGRIQRANNIKKNLYINLVTKGGVDEAVDKALQNKSDFSERIYAEARS